MTRITRFTMGMLLGSCLVGSAGIAAAQPARDRREIRQDKRELKQDRRETRDDWRDLKRLEGLLARFDAAQRANDLPQLGALDGELRALVAGEVREGQRELARDGAEARRDTREVRAERREERRDVAQGRPGAAARDGRDLADDKRDRRDDVRDVQAQMGQLNAVVQIADQLQAIAGRVDPQSLAQRRALHVQLIGVARAELAGDGAERREDRKELREDRRERREDRRERRGQ